MGTLSRQRRQNNGRRRVDIPASRYGIVLPVNDNYYDRAGELWRVIASI